MENGQLNGANYLSEYFLESDGVDDLVEKWKVVCFLRGLRATFSLVGRRILM